MYNSRDALTSVFTRAMVEIGYEDPFDTAEQLVEGGKTLYINDVNKQLWKHWLLESSDQWYHKLAENAILPEDLQAFDLTKYSALRDGTHALLRNQLFPHELEWGEKYNNEMGWYRSQERVGDIPIAGYLSRKTWAMNEDSLLLLLLVINRLRVKDFIAGKYKDKIIIPKKK